MLALRHGMPNPSKQTGEQESKGDCAGTGADIDKAEAVAQLLAVAVAAHRDASQALAKGQALAAVQAAASALQVLDAPRDIQVLILGFLP